MNTKVKTNVTKVRFGTLNSLEVSALTQYDKGQIIEFIESFADGTEVQFATTGAAETINKIIENNKVEIPDTYMESTATIIAWVKVIATDSETTIKEIRIPITPRTKPADYIAPEDEPTFREQMQQIMNDTKEVAESVKQDADEGKFDGKDGADGAEGFSPSAKVERITDGALITVTDKAGTTQAEVYDGKGGSSSGIAIDGIKLTETTTSAELGLAKKTELTPYLKKSEVLANMSATSELPIQSKVAYAEHQNLQNDINANYEDIVKLQDSKADADTTYNKDEVNSLISAIDTGSIEVVESLPTEGKSKVIYLVPNGSSRGSDIYDEYIWITSTSKFEKVGNTQITIDSTLSATSTNPVQNKVINAEITAVKSDIDANYNDIAELQKGNFSQTTKVLSTEDYTTDEKTKLAGLSNYDDTEIKNTLTQQSEEIADLQEALVGVSELIGGDE